MLEIAKTKYSGPPIYWKTRIKGVIYNQEKTYSRLEISSGIGWTVEAVDGGVVLGGRIYLQLSYY